MDHFQLFHCAKVVLAGRGILSIIHCGLLSPVSMVIMALVLVVMRMSVRPQLRLLDVKTPCSFFYLLLEW